MIPTFLTQSLSSGYFIKAKLEMSLYETSNFKHVASDVFGLGKDSVGRTLLDEVSKYQEPIQNSLISIGYALCLLFFIISLVELANSERFTLETFVKFFAKLVISVFLVSISPTLGKNVHDLGDAIGQIMQNDLSKEDKEKGTEYTYYISTHTIDVENGKEKYIATVYKFNDSYTATYIDDQGNKKSQSFTAQNLPEYHKYSGNTKLQAAVVQGYIYQWEATGEDSLGWNHPIKAVGGLVDGVTDAVGVGLVSAGMYLITMSLYIVGFSRLIEIVIRQTLLPIPLALMADDGWKGTGGRYLKKFLALVIQGGLIILICNIGKESMISAIREHHYVITIGIGTALSTLVFKSITFINDALGV